MLLQPIEFLACQEGPVPLDKGDRGDTLLMNIPEKDVNNNLIEKTIYFELFI